MQENNSGFFSEHSVVGYCYSMGPSSAQPAPDKIVRYGRSRLFKVIEIGTNRKPTCDFQ